MLSTKVITEIYKTTSLLFSYFLDKDETLCLFISSNSKCRLNFCNDHRLNNSKPLMFPGNLNPYRINRNPVVTDRDVDLVLIKRNL